MNDRIYAATFYVWRALGFVIGGAVHAAGRAIDEAAEYFGGDDD